MKQILFTIALLGGLSFSTVTSAQAVGPTWTCQLTGKLSGISISPIISFQILGGNGYASCRAASGEIQTVPVHLRILGAGVGLGISFIHQLQIYSASIGLVEGARGLFGRYSVGATAGFTLIAAGLDFDAALSVSKAGGGSFEVGLKGKQALGLEAKLQGTFLEITPLR